MGCGIVMLYANQLNFSIDKGLINEPKQAIVNYEKLLTLYRLDNRRQLISLLPKDLQDKKVCIYLVNIDFEEEMNAVTIHSHTKEKCVVNIYLEANDEETIFYDGVKKEVPLLNGKSSFFKKYSFEDMEKVESFVAKTGDCWLLNTTQPHSVLSKKRKGSRKILQIYLFDTEYTEALKLFEVNHGGN
jgi:hypothetical protein